MEGFTRCHILKACVVRIILVIHSMLAYWRVVTVYEDKTYWLLLFLLVTPVVELIRIIVKQDCRENNWFCSCFFCYLLSTIPAICLLEMNRLDRYTEIYGSKNVTQRESLTPIDGVTLPVKLSPDIWVSFIEQAMLFLMISARLLLPRGKLSREKLSQLVLVYIGLASDNSDLFLLFDESQVRQDRALTIVILVVWSVSMFLFTSGLTAAEDEKKKLLSILLTFVLQDLPYLIVRLYALIHYQLITYSIIFFTFKNIFVTVILVYRFCTFCFGLDSE